MCVGLKCFDAPVNSEISDHEHLLYRCIVHLMAELCLQLGLLVRMHVAAGAALDGYGFDRGAAPAREQW